jgi:MFS family permease
LFALRLILGIGESVAFPANSKIIALNFSEEHRGIANAATSAGLVMGPGIGMLAGGMLMGRFGWRPFFLVLGLVSMLWLIPWIKVMPRQRSGLPASSTGAPSLIEFLRLRSAWGTCAGLFSSNYVSYFLITWLPFYLVRERHFSMTSMAKIGGTAYLLGAGTALLAGWLSDRWIMAGGTPTRVRKTFVAGGLALAGTSLAFCAFSGPNLCVVLLTLGVMSFGICSSNIWAISQTLAGPQAAGRWVGFQNFVGNLSGVVAPAITGFVLQRTGQFYWAFIIVAGVALTGTASWIFLVGRVEQVSWGQPIQVEAVTA